MKNKSNFLPENHKSSIEEKTMSRGENAFSRAAVILTVAVLIFFAGQTVKAQTDLSMRQALYYNGAKTVKVDTTSKYVTPGGTMKLKKSEALNCAAGFCEFNFAFFVFRDNVASALSTYALIRGNGLGIVGNTVSFAAGEKIRDVVHKFKLKTGVNKVIVEVDPYKKLAETNENNNSFEVTIVVEP